MPQLDGAGGQSDQFQTAYFPWHMLTELTSFISTFSLFLLFFFSGPQKLILGTFQILCKIALSLWQSAHFDVIFFIPLGSSQMGDVYLCVFLVCLFRPLIQAVTWQSHPSLSFCLLDASSCPRISSLSALLLVCFLFSNALSAWSWGNQSSPVHSFRSAEIQWCQRELLIASLPGFLCWVCCCLLTEFQASLKCLSPRSWVRFGCGLLHERFTC